MFRHSVGADHGGMPELSKFTPGNRTLIRTSSRDLAGDRHGIVTRAQLLAAGVSRSAIVARCAVGRLHRIHPGVYAAVAPELLTEEGQLLAALLAAGDGALLSHGTAAWRWRIIPAPPSVMQLAVPRRRTRRGGRDAVRQCGNLRADDVTLNGRFASTSVPRTLLDLATRYTRGALLRALAEAEFQHDLRPGTSSARCAAATPAAPTSAPRSDHAPGYGQMKSRAGARLPPAPHPPRDRAAAAQRTARPLDLRTAVVGHRSTNARPDDVIADLLDALA